MLKVEKAAALISWQKTGPITLTENSYIFTSLCLVRFFFLLSSNRIEVWRIAVNMYTFTDILQHKERHVVYQQVINDG